MAAPDRGLVALIEHSEDIARALAQFVPAVGEAATDITALVSEFYAISASLRDLRKACLDPRNIHDIEYYGEARHVVVEALRRTYQDLEQFLDQKDRLTKRTKREAYREVWHNLDTFFYHQSGYDLLARIGCIKFFIQELCLVLNGKPDSPEFSSLFKRIDLLWHIQQESLVAEIGRLQLTQSQQGLQAPRVKSWERKRPQPAPPAPPAAGLGYHRQNHRPFPFRSGPAGGSHHHHQPPHSPPGESSSKFWSTAPEPTRPPSPPASSTLDAASSTGSSPSSAGSDMKNHWLVAAFAQSRPTTNFDTTGTESTLFDEHQPGIGSQLRKKGYEEVLILPFENILEAKIYMREKDSKARIVCKYERSGRKTIACRPISSLNVYRQDSCLRLCKMEGKKKAVAWATLRFPSYERLVLFFCSFLALKVSDMSTSPHQLEDYALKGEKEVFACTIVDDNYRHALQIFKDTGSKGIRLQASILKGPMKRAPVWTAFINYKIPAIAWIKRSEPLKIHLADLTRYIFRSDYEPHQGPNGEHEIFFDDSKDADRFSHVIEELAEGRL